MVSSIVTGEVECAGDSVKNSQASFTARSVLTGEMVVALASEDFGDSPSNFPKSIMGTMLSANPKAVDAIACSELPSLSRPAGDDREGADAEPVCSTVCGTAGEGSISTESCY